MSSANLAFSADEDQPVQEGFSISPVQVGNSPVQGVSSPVVQETIPIDNAVVDSTIDSDVIQENSEVIPLPPAITDEVPGLVLIFILLFN
jgi:hypothetical protein